MTFATNMHATASRLLTIYGRAVTMERVTEGAYDTATSAPATGSTSSYSGYGHPSFYEIGEVDEVHILSTDVGLLLYSTTAPLIGDTASIDSVSHRVMDVQTVSAQGTNIVYKLQLRK